MSTLKIDYQGRNLDELFEEADMLSSKIKKEHKELEGYIQKLEELQKKGVIENFVMYSVAKKAYDLLDEAKGEDLKCVN